MTDMLDRAAKASFCTEHGSDGCVWERSTEDSKGYWRDSVRAALLAALDPEDKVLVALMTRASVMEIADGCPVPDDFHEVDYAATKSAIKALRAYIAQGEPNP